MFIHILGGDYIINTDHISDIDATNDGHWDVTMSSGETYSVEGGDLERLIQIVEGVK